LTQAINSAVGIVCLLTFLVLRAFLPAYQLRSVRGAVGGRSPLRLACRRARLSRMNRLLC
jgi:hypothetical protein